MLPTLLNPLRRKLGRVYADGAYDSKANHQLIVYQGAAAYIPPCTEGLAHWKDISGYHQRSLAETAMYRFKQLMTGKISLRNYNGQVEEIMTYVCTMNKLNALALPVRKPQA